MIKKQLMVATLVLAFSQGYSMDSNTGTFATMDGQGQKNDVQPDEELLQGTWDMKSFERDGREVEDLPKGRVIIKGKELSLGEEADAEDTFTIRLTPQDNPKGIDLILPAEPKAPTLGIYKLEGDLLTLCLRGRGSRNKDGTPTDPIESTRPKGFSSENGNMLIVLIRRK